MNRQREGLEHPVESQLPSSPYRASPVPPGYAWNLFGEAGEGRGASGGTVRNLPLRSRPQSTLTGGDESD
jgi:hypothetical protein